MNESLRLFVQKIPKLPTLPSIAQEVLTLTNDESTSIDELENTIQKDPSTSAKILGFSNSAFYGLSTPVSTIRDAVIRIGFNNVKNIALGISLMTILGNSKEAHAMDYQRIFRHSFAVGIISKLFSDELAKDISDKIFTGGLLHDIGFLVLNRFLSENYQKVIDEFESDAPLLEAEKKVLGFTHADIGTWLADKWSLPDTLTEIILYHHTPSLSKKHQKDVSLVHLADIVATRKSYGITMKEPLYPFDFSTLEMIGTTEAHLMDMESKISDNLFPDRIFE